MNFDWLVYKVECLNVKADTPSPYFEIIRFGVVFRLSVLVRSYWVMDRPLRIGNPSYRPRWVWASPQGLGIREKTNFSLFQFNLQNKGGGY